jgi:hypothetical protein
MINGGRPAIILCPWHWVETARTKSLPVGGELVDSMDGLGSHWLRDRRDLEKIEVHSSFFKFIGVEYARLPAIFTGVELLSSDAITSTTCAKRQKKWNALGDVLGCHSIHPLSRPCVFGLAWSNPAC